MAHLDGLNDPVVAARPGRPALARVLHRCGTGPPRSQEPRSAPGQASVANGHRSSSIVTEVRPMQFEPRSSAGPLLLLLGLALAAVSCGSDEQPQETAPTPVPAATPTPLPAGQ